MPKLDKFESYNDGILTICETEGRSLIRNKATGIRYGNRTIGVQRYWSAQTAGNKVDKLIAIPISLMTTCHLDISDIILIEKAGPFEAGQYKISQIQPKPDKHSVYLSLERTLHEYGDKRDGS